VGIAKDSGKFFHQSRRLQAYEGFTFNHVPVPVYKHEVARLIQKELASETWL